MQVWEWRPSDFGLNRRTEAGAVVVGDPGVGLVVALDVGGLEAVLGPVDDGDEPGERR